MSTDTNSKDNADTAPKKEDVKPAAEKKPTEKKVETKPAEKKAEAKPAEKKVETKPAEKKAEAKPAEKPAEKKATKHDFDLRFFNATRVAKLQLITPGIVQYDKTYPSLKLGPSKEARVLPLTPFFAARLGVTIEEVE